ncbi:MAG: O-methyltransferase [Balneolaceae bacterium]|nr:O-methyltransferase [Balneolaceae bacterium]
MKKHRGKPILKITDPAIDEYATEHSIQDSEELKSLIASSDAELEYIDMLSGSLVGGLLQMLIKISGTKHVLEIGTFTGYSAIKMAEALPDDGSVTTLEMNLRYQNLAEKHFDESAQKSKITLIKGNAQELIDTLDDTFDFVYLDADKLRYQSYFEKVMPKLKPGGLLITDNVLWDGTVLNPLDQKAKAIADFNAFVANDNRVETVLLPIRDGVTIIRKK